MTLNSVRTLFLSDLHLGFRHSRAGRLLTLLDRCEPTSLYLIGDTIDGWYLQSGCRWNEDCSLVMHRIFELAAKGTKVYLTVGNHDRFLSCPVLRSMLAIASRISVNEEFEHKLADGRRFLILHGDQFDQCEKISPITSWLLCRGYEGLLRLNDMWGRLTQKSSTGQQSLIAAVKRKIDRLVLNVQQYRCRVIRHARSRRCDGVICGHIHVPEIHEQDGLTYCNTGDWIENCSALLEHHSGALELVHLD